MPRKRPPEEPQVPVSPEHVWWQRRSRLRPDDLAAADAGLQDAIRAHLPELEALLEKATRQYEDGVYRFWHWSFKVYRLQDVTARIAAMLRVLSSDGTVHPWFEQIIDEGTGRKFERSHNDRWLHETRPIVEAFLHAKYFLEMVCR